MLDDLPATLQLAVAEARATRQGMSQRQTTLSLPGGRSPTLRLTVLPLEAGKRKGPVALLLQDVNALTHAEQRLRQLDRLASVGTFAAAMAHEIKNALVVGKTFFDLLLEKNQDADVVELVRRELSRVESLVSQMLRFTGPDKPAVADVRLHEVLNHSLRLVDGQLRDRQVRLQRDFAAHSDLIRGDEYQLEQAFVNLLLNAVEAMGLDGELTIATYATAAPAARGARGRSQIRITIQDSGIGISPQAVARLFSPFFTTKAGGTGLGLFITQRIIREHGGVISVKSKAGQGTAFQIQLPALG
jgi:signal transduction histidine kinase